MKSIDALALADPGDQKEVGRAEKIILETAPPYLRVRMNLKPPYLKVIAVVLFVNGLRHF